MERLMQEYYGTASPICIIVTLLSSNSRTCYARACLRALHLAEVHRPTERPGTDSPSICLMPHIPHGIWRHSPNVPLFARDRERERERERERKRGAICSLFSFPRLNSSIYFFFFFFFFFFLQDYVLYFIQRVCSPVMLMFKLSH